MNSRALVAFAVCISVGALLIVGLNHYADKQFGLIPKSNGVWLIVVGVSTMFLPLVFLFAVAALAWSRVRFFRAKVGERSCVQCGYDIRKSKDTCPECGAGIYDLNSKSTQDA